MSDCILNEIAQLPTRLNTKYFFLMRLHNMKAPGNRQPVSRNDLQNSAKQLQCGEEEKNKVQITMIST